METRAHHVLVGTFVLGMLIAMFVAVVWLARVQFNREFALYDIYFTGSVTGLNTGAPVRYNGIQIGRVEDIRIDPQNVGRVRVRVEVDPGVPIKSDAVASLEMQGITGFSFVQITGGSQSAPPLEAKDGERYPVIASRASRLEQVFANAPELLEHAIVLADRLADIVNDDNRAAIADGLKQFRATMDALGTGNGDIRTILADGAATLRDVRALTEQTRGTLTELSQSLTGREGLSDKLNQTVGDLNQMTHRLNDFAAHVDQLVQENRSGLRDFSQRGLPDLMQLVTETRMMINGLTRLTADIERDPARFFFGDRREGYRPR